MQVQSKAWPRCRRKQITRRAESSGSRRNENGRGPCVSSSGALISSPAPMSFDTTFFSIPTEVAQYLLTFCHPCDVVAFSRTCRTAHALVHNSTDQYLWRTLFLTYPFDDLRKSLDAPPDSSAIDWRTQLKRRVHAEVVTSKRVEGTPDEMAEVYNVLSDAIAASAPIIPGGWNRPSSNLAWVRRKLDCCKRPDPPLEEASPFARLSSFLMPIILTLSPGDDILFSILSRRAARTFVYDLRNYTEERLWGPYQKGGQAVNWLHLRADIIVITMNLREFGAHWPKAFQPPLLVRGLEATRAYSAPEMSRRSERDWAGVEGHWMRVVCFCDYR